MKIVIIDLDSFLFRSFILIGNFFPVILFGFVDHLSENIVDNLFNIKKGNYLFSFFHFALFDQGHWTFWDEVKDYQDNLNESKESWKCKNKSPVELSISMRNCKNNFIEVHYNNSRHNHDLTEDSLSPSQINRSYLVYKKWSHPHIASCDDSLHHSKS